MTLTKKLLFGLLGLIILALSVFFVRADVLGAQITSITPSGGAIGATGRVSITFAQAMNTRDVEQRIHIQPAIAGNFTWDGNTVSFVPQQAWQAGATYRVSLSAGATAKDGRKVLRSMTAQFSVRQPEILYLSTQAKLLRLFSISPSGGTPRQISPSGADVFDYAPSHDGEQVVYSVKNAEQGMDLWLARRDGSQNHRLINCGADQCSQPAWLPDSSHIVFYRQMAQGNGSESGREALTGTWSVNPKTGETDYLFQGEHPSVSPDGTQLMLVIPSAGVIHVLNVDTGQGIEFEADSDIAPVWFPDSSRIVFARTQAQGDVVQIALFQADIKTRQITPLLTQAVTQENLSAPAITPDSRQLIVGMHGFGEVSSEQLWLMDIDGSQPLQVTADPLYSNSSYSWNPWGTGLVFQRLELGVSAPTPQVMVWDRQTARAHQIVSQATLPQWLP